MRLAAVGANCLQQRLQLVGLAPGDAGDEPFAGEAALATGAAGKPAASDAAPPADLAAVLGRVVAVLAETTGAERVAAWARDESGTLQVLAAMGELAELEGPDAFAGADSRGGPNAPR